MLTWPFRRSAAKKLPTRSRIFASALLTIALWTISAELGVHPADAHAEQHAAARQLLDRRHRLGGRQRGPVRQDEH